MFITITLDLVNLRIDFLWILNLIITKLKKIMILNHDHAVSFFSYLIIKSFCYRIWFPAKSTCYNVNI